MRRYLFICLTISSTAALGACDEALDNPPEAAVSVALNNHATLNCPVVKNDALPDDSEVARLGPTTSPETVAGLPRVVQGNPGEDVQCSVRQTAPSAFTISADLSGQGRVFSIRGSVAAGVGTGLEVTWLSPTLSSVMQSSACTATVNEQREGGGAIRLSYECPDFVDPTQPDGACALSGSIVIERCDE